jgi:hypothetical protein
MWPRRAPVWLQLANWFEFADWQFALSFAPSVIPSVARVMLTFVFAMLGVAGSRWHREADRRTWLAVLLLFLCGSVGVIVYLNLKAGASFGWQFVPDDAGHEARERDYFFVLGFWAWGLWAAMGAMVLAKRLRLPVGAGVALASMPIVLNWSAVNRRTEPEASLPRMVASALLDGLPQRAVLFVAGDNDSYPLWYLQQVEARRRDVTIVTMPLLGAPWYAAELQRRHQLAAPAGTGTVLGLSRGIADAARRLGRPVAVAVTVPASDRSQLRGPWTVIGTSLVRADGAVGLENQKRTSTQVTVDTVLTTAAASSIENWRRGRTVHPAIDPVHDYFLRVLGCPSLVLLREPSKAQLASRDSTCNLNAR